MARGAGRRVPTTTAPVPPPSWKSSGCSCTARTSDPNAHSNFIPTLVRYPSQCDDDDRLSSKSLFTFAIFKTKKAEEVGNRGSQQIADAYKKEGVVVAGMMQLDMTAYVRPGTEPVIAVIEDYVSVPLSKFVAQLAAVYSNIPSKPSKCGYGCRYVHHHHSYGPTLFCCSPINFVYPLQ